MTNYEIWQAVLAEFELKLSKANFTTWFSHTGICAFQGGQAAICVPSAFIRSWLERKFHSDIVKSLERVTGKPVKKVEYRVDNIKNIEEYECALVEKSGSNQVSLGISPLLVGERKPVISEFGLNPSYTFANFIVGKNNELAHAAAQAVATRPGEAYNPLFIYGGVGLGKTHLLQAIGNALLTLNPQTKVLCASCEKFINDYVTMVKEGRAKEFKNRYRSVNLLLIDDIQFISGKEQTQDEFFHTFNELHQHNKQVVMTSDRPPKAIPALEERLRSRFEWGMIADISAPDLETRLAILKAKCQERRLALDEELIQLIAITIYHNIRELEGALNKIAAFHQLKNMKPSKETVRSILASFAEQSMRKAITPRELIAMVAKFYDVEVNDITGKSREKKLSFPRQVIMFLLRQELKLSYPAIGDYLGGRDHTTAMHAHTKILTELENDLKLKQEIEMIKQQLYASATK